MGSRSRALALAAVVAACAPAIAVRAAPSSSEPRVADAPPTGQWQVVAPKPLDTYGAASASDGTFAYRFGGYSSSQGQTVSNSYKYDPATDTWSTLAPMPQAEG